MKQTKRRSSNRRNAPRKTRSKLSDHFSKRDFICKDSGEFKISLGLVGALEHLRSSVRKRINIVKGFESLEVAEKKGKLKRNLHTQGLAADIIVDDFPLIELFKAAETIEEIKGIGLNVSENHVHIDTRKADRLIWVEENDQIIEITDENRSKYLGPT